MPGVSWRELAAQFAGAAAELPIVGHQWRTAVDELERDVIVERDAVVADADRVGRSERGWQREQASLVVPDRAIAGTSCWQLLHHMSCCREAKSSSKSEANRWQCQHAS